VDREEMAQECRRVIEEWEDALEVYTLEESPQDYAIAQYNLGAAHLHLAEVEEKGENSRRAIAAFEEALRVYTLQEYPRDYALTQNSLGNAYGTLAEAEEKGGELPQGDRCLEGGA
jgi:tetratricopeptide (TPR) repeat protein